MTLFSIELRAVAWLMLAWLVMILVVWALTHPVVLLAAPVPVPFARRRWRRRRR